MTRRPEIKLGHSGGMHRHSAFSLLGRGTDDKLMTQGRERGVEGSSDELRKGLIRAIAFFQGPGWAGYGAQGGQGVEPGEGSCKSVTRRAGR